jgi:hypothetical protein
MPRPRSNDPKRLKAAQADKLRRIALDGRRRPTDRHWAIQMLKDAGEDLSPTPKAKGRRHADH